MQNADIAMLRCVDCRGDLALEQGEERDGAIINGMVRCVSCGRRYPIIDEVGIFFRKGDLAAYLAAGEIAALKGLGYERVLEGISGEDLTAIAEQVAVAENWEYQHENVYRWEQEIGKDGYHGKRLFWTFIPLAPESVRGKVVYAACVGRGKEVYHVLQESPRKVVASEIGAEVHSIPGIIGRRRKDLVLLRCDVSYSPLKPEQVDVTICDHALQHIHDHARGFSQLVEALKPGGIVSFCTYSYENNFLMTHIVEPAKRILRRLPLGLVRGLAFFPALAIYLLIHLVYLPLSRVSGKWTRRLPLHDHMIFWSTSTLKFIWSACFDLMHAPISYHFRKDEVVALASLNDVTIVTLTNTHGTTWSLVGKKA